MAEAHLELIRQRARLRAFKAYGTPVEGEWEETRGQNRMRLGPAMARLRCGTCRAPLMLALCEPPESSWYRVYGGCHHLEPLLGEDPLEVRAILDLELLAGE
jgi:hypothetical protein